jgi:hypothetical protein
VGPIDGGHQSGTFPLPPLQAINLGASAPEFGFYLLAEAALVVVVLSHIDKLHSACFAGAVLVIAPVGEAGPAPVSTGETLLVVKAHAYQMRQCHSLQRCDQTHLLPDPVNLFQVSKKGTRLALTSC